MPGLHAAFFLTREFAVANLPHRSPIQVHRSFHSNSARMGAKRPGPQCPRCAPDTYCAREAK